MREIEVKILNIDREKVEQKLIAMGAKKHFEGEIEAHFFEPNQGRDVDATIRLRKMGEKTYLTFKSKVESNFAKVRDEYEIEVSDFDNAMNILKGMGLKAWLVMKKHRISYKIGDTSFEFDKHNDQYSYVPEFLEIEAPDEETLKHYAHALGYGEEDCKPWTILDIVESLSDDDKH